MNNELDSLLHHMLRDLGQPDFYWQLGLLLLCAALAWSVSRLLTDKRVDQLANGAAWKFGRGGLRRLAFPLVAGALVLAVRPFAQRYMHVNLLSVALPLMFSLASIRMVFYVLRHSFSQSGWLNNFERVFAFTVWGVVAMHITGVLPSVIDVFESVGFTVGKQHLNLWQVIQGGTTVAATVLGALWISGLIESRLQNADGLDVNLREVLSRVSKALMVVVAVLISLPMVGIDLTTLSVFGGALGVGLGLGLQRIASNYVAGFIILLERSIRIGNVISVADQRGEVTRITTRYTVLRSPTGIESLVPNEQLVGSVVLNESYSDRRVRIAIGLQVAYESDLELATRLMNAAALAQERVLRDPEPVVLIKAFADSGIDLELGIWIQDPEEGTGALRSDIYHAIWRAFRAHGVIIPFPQREVRVVGSGPILNPIPNAIATLESSHV